LPQVSAGGAFPASAHAILVDWADAIRSVAVAQTA
jgi:hypothetical protein